MSLKNTVLEKIKDEIQNDPENRGYASKTDEEIKELLNNPYEVDVVIKEKKTARINIILLRIAETPNVVTLVDLTDAQNV